MSVEIMRKLSELGRRVLKLETREGVLPSGYLEKYFTKTLIADNVATDVFRISTTDNAASVDGGGYQVEVHALVGHGLANNSSNTAVKGFVAQFARAMRNDGTLGGNTAVLEIGETASAATTGATRDIGAVTMTVVENSEFECDVMFQVDLTGAGVTTAQVVCWVRVIWFGFYVEPVLTQL